MTHWEFNAVVTMLSACDHPLEIKIETLDYLETRTETPILPKSSFS